jgi:hypothetical protein
LRLTVLSSNAKGEATDFTASPDGRRVALSFHRSSDTFRIGTLKSIIEKQAHWTEDDLCRLSLLP